MRCGRRRCGGSPSERARNGRGRRERSQGRWYRSPFMRQVRPVSPLGLVTLLALLFALVAGAASCSAKKADDAAPDTTLEATTTTTVPAPSGTLIATAKVPSLTVFA